MKPDEIETLDEFGLELLRLRTNSGLTRSQIMEMVTDAGGEISPATISAMCNADYVPRPYYLRIFLQALGIEGEELEAWQRARDRVWVARRAAKKKNRVGSPATVTQPTGVEGELFLVRQQLARMEGMLLALAREWGISKRDA